MPIGEQDAVFLGLVGLSLSLAIMLFAAQLRMQVAASWAKAMTLSTADLTRPAHPRERGFWVGFGLLTDRLQR